MINSTKVTIAFAWVAFALVTNPIIAEVNEGAHPYHVSMAEVNWNAQTKKFEVALCVWPADLEKALSQQEGRTIDLQKEPKVDHLMQAYVSKRFFIRSSNPAASSMSQKSIATKSPQPKDASSVSNADTASEDTTSDAPPRENESEPSLKKKPSSPNTIKWYGHEANAKQAWLYFELDGSGDGEWTFENRIFFELNDDQLNHVEWAGSGKAQTLVVSHTSPRVALPMTKAVTDKTTKPGK